MKYRELFIEKATEFHGVPEVSKSHEVSQSHFCGWVTGPDTIAKAN